MPFHRSLPPPAFLAPHAVPALYYPHRTNVCYRPSSRPTVPLHPIALPIASANTAKKSAKKHRNLSPTIVNRQARFRYDILDTYECGIELLGTEIKSVRAGSLTLRDGYARVKDGQLFLHNVNIAPWSQAAAYFNHDPLRLRRLLLHKRSIRKLAGKQTDPGLTLIPTRAYFSQNGYFKVEVALCRGKQMHDRRADIKKREDDRNMRRVVKATFSGL